MRSVQQLLEGPVVTRNISLPTNLDRQEFIEAIVSILVDLAQQGPVPIDEQEEPYPVLPVYQPSQSLPVASVGEN